MYAGNGARCDPVSGECACTAGWSGAGCLIPCPTGTYGPSCNSTCQCANDATCDSQWGTCFCLSGWKGVHCEDPCSEG